MRNVGFARFGLALTLCGALLLHGCRSVDDGYDTSNETPPIVTETETNISMFSETWYNEYKYYNDSYGRFFEINQVSSTEVELDVHGDYVFRFLVNNYEVDDSKYIYKDDYWNALIIYSPEDNHSIEIILDNESLYFKQFTEEEFNSAQIDYEKKLEFSDEWYRDSVYAWSFFDGDGFAIDWIEIDGIESFWVNELQFISNEYEFDNECYGYIYESTYTDCTVHLAYYPSENIIELIYDDIATYSYDIVSEDEYITYSEESSDDNTDTDDGGNNDVTYEDSKEMSYSDAEIYQAAYYFIDLAIADSLYANYYWEFVREAGVSPYVGGGYTAKFYMYSQELHSYKYLRINIGVGPQGFYYLSSGW